MNMYSFKKKKRIRLKGKLPLIRLSLKLQLVSITIFKIIFCLQDFDPTAVQSRTLVCNRRVCFLFTRVTTYRANHLLLKASGRGFRYSSASSIPTWRLWHSLESVVEAAQEKKIYFRFTSVGDRYYNPTDYCV